MDYFSQRLSELRKEIANLRTNNASYSQQSDHSQIDQSAYELRSNRLLQIKKELSGMLARPREGSVWWERSRGVQP
jgi:uncharacterized protein YdcH (DUF465 family)